MKVTIVSHRPHHWHPQTLLNAALKAGFKAEIRDFKPSDLTPNLVDELGDVVIWRSSSLDLTSERTALGTFLKDKILLNRTVFKMPAATTKFFQQKYLLSQNAIAQWSIPTYRLKNASDLDASLKKAQLSWPVIAKPNSGAEGKGIKLLNSKSDFSRLKKPQDYIFQNFIANDGDWRVIVLGGVPLGAMKRRAAPGNFLNNISQGGTSALETDGAILRQIYKMATKTASLFNLTFGGVDIIRDQKTGKFYVLEINTMVAWDEEFGFESITGVAVADRLMAWIDECSSGLQGSMASRVENYYKKRIDNIDTYGAFHFVSRLWLWTGSSWARQQLKQRQDYWLGENEQATSRMIKERLQRSEDKSQVVNQRVPYRRDSFRKYPKLAAYNALLFRELIGDTVFGRDIRSLIEQQVPDSNFLDLLNKLLKDEDALRLLSTHAVNYIYLLKNYWRDDPKKLGKIKFDPNKLIALLGGYQQLEDSKIINRQISLKLRVVLLTHAIIGESRFYARKVTDRSYKNLCVELENIISQNYFEVSLDNKFEFLVCAELCDFKTNNLRQLIEQEAAHSTSWAGNFLVDTLNVHKKATADHLAGAEHRNVLYLMSQKPYKPATIKEAKK